MESKIMICPKCGQQMKKSGRVRLGHKIKQRWMCSRLAGCGHIRYTELEDQEKIINK